MSLIKIELLAPPTDGMDIKFKAPCDCSAITGLLVTYPEGSQEFTFRDSHCNNLVGLGNLFAAGAYVKVIVDIERGHAYIQNADNNVFLNSSIFGTYTHDGDNLTGCGENGKFKATASGSISSINVNGVSCSVKCGEESSMDLVAGCWYMFILDGNTVNFNAGGAGAGLNFKVVGGTTQPVSPKENTIWINTSTAITGYEICAVTNPTWGSSFGIGFVYIYAEICNSGSPPVFNALKKNIITMYPSLVHQYMGGTTWVTRDAYLYASGTWHPLWRGQLYSPGNEWTRYTGGWAAVGFKPDDARGPGTPSIEKTSEYIRMYAPATSGPGCVLIPYKDIDLTEYKTLTVKYRGTYGSGGWGYIGVLNRASPSWRYNFVAEAWINSTNVVTTASVDVSGVSGSYCLGMFINTNGIAFDMYVYEITLS